MKISKLGVGSFFLLLFFGCAPSGAVDDRPPTWPYPSLEKRGEGPSEVVGYPDGLSGQWLQSNPLTGGVLIESIDPRYAAGYVVGPRNHAWYDFGFGTEIEALVATPDGEWLMMARYYGGFEYETPVTVRALLEVDLQTPILRGSIPLQVNLESRGMVFDDRKNRVFALQTTEDGFGSVALIDLYRGSVLRKLPVGTIPRGVDRKGLAFSSHHLELAMFTGGDPDVSDFAPRSGADVSEPAGLLLLHAETFEVVEKLQLPEGFDPKALVFSQATNDLVLLLTQREVSLVVTVSLDFHTVEHLVELSGGASDLALVGQVALVPTDRGLFAVDLNLGQWSTVTLFQTEQSGEIAVSPRGDVAWLRVFERGMAQPGLLEIDLATGSAVEVLP